MSHRELKLKLYDLLQEKKRRDAPTLTLVENEKRELYLNNFYEFRKFLAGLRRQKFIDGWWQKAIAAHIEQFRKDLVAGLRPKLFIGSPPQHGKSWQAIDAMLWFIANDPNMRTIFASYSDRLGVRANRAIQKILKNPEWTKIFPDVRITTPDHSATVKPKVTEELIELYNTSGYFRNTTIGGPINGESLDFGLIDDVLKGRAEANSETIREKTWDWFTDDFFSRFSESAGFICIGTCWHVDDPIQRMIKNFPSIKVVSYPAIATEDEEFRKAGEPLFPELKSLEFLEERRALMPTANWQSLYQQNPIVDGGNLFKDTMIDFREISEDMDYEFIVCDTAYKSQQENDYQVATLFGVRGSRLFVKDVWRVKMDASDVEVPLEAFIRKHKKYGFRFTWIEPKGHGIYLNQKFKSKGLGIPREDDLKEFFKDRRLDKAERGNNAVPHLADKKLYINSKITIREQLKAELLQFPNGKHDDFVDTVIDGIKVAYGRKTSILNVL